MIGGRASEPSTPEGVDRSSEGCWERVAVDDRSVEVGGATAGVGCCAAVSWRLWASVVEAELSLEELSNR